MVIRFTVSSKKKKNITIANCLKAYDVELNCFERSELKSAGYTAKMLFCY